MKINLVSIGKLDLQWKKIAHSYLERINRFSQINVIELREQIVKNVELKKELETKLILKHLQPNSKIILCSLKGRQYNSQEFANQILESQNNLTFVIGGSNGVLENQFSQQMTFSKLTFPHQLFRIILLEQIYRAFTIINKGKYHK